MRIIYTPRSSPDEPAEFGLEYQGPLGLGKRVKHLERDQVETLLESAYNALQEHDLATGAIVVEDGRIKYPAYEGGGCL